MASQSIYGALVSSHTLYFAASALFEQRVPSSLYTLDRRLLNRDRAELIEETTKARLEFSDRYWKNVSELAKDFIKALVKPDPLDRPTVDEALNHPVGS
jgi:serine/threonine protein kinase